LHDVIRTAAARIAAALGHRNFRLLWIGALTSSIGTWMQKVAQAWLILTIAGSRSAFFLGLDTFLSELPILLFTMIGGVVADRRDRRHMMLTSQITQMVVALGLAMLIHTGRIQLAHVLTLSFVVGCVRAFGGPAYQSLLPTIVRQEHLANAIALNSVQENLARVIGPVVAGAALSAFGLAACFGLNGLSFLFVIVAIIALRDVHVPPLPAERMVAQFKTGVEFVRRSPALIDVMVLGFSGSFLGLPLLTFLPVITRDVFHETASFYTSLMTFAGAGAVAGALVVAWLGRHEHMGRLLLIGLALLGATMVGFALSRTTYVSASVLFAGGALLTMCSSLTISLAQLLAPAELRGRVVSLYLVAFSGGSPLGGLAAGWLIIRIGSAPAMLMANGAALVVLALSFLFRRGGVKNL
jgi:MFS family permease